MRELCESYGMQQGTIFLRKNFREFEVKRNCKWYILVTSGEKTMYIFSLVILVFLPNGDTTGTIQHFDNKQECLESGALLVNQYMKEFEGELILPACIAGHYA